MFDVVARDGQQVVVRIHRSPADCAAAIHWSQTLGPLGVPLPKLLAHHVGAEAFQSWIILERLPGVDLGQAYSGLSFEQKQAIARRIVEAQRRVATLPAGDGYGFVSLPRDWPHGSWIEVVRAELARARRRVREVAAVNERCVDRVEARLEQFAPYFASVQPIPFLDDTTTKNVIIDEGRLTGIVDVDCLCYGDPLYTVGLTRMSLLSMNADTDYTDLWLDALQATPQHRSAVQFYSAVFCVNFLSEQGQQFNRDEPPSVEGSEVARLEAILDRLLLEWS